MQGRNRDTDVENECEDTVGKGAGGTNWEIRIDIYIFPCVKQTTTGNLVYSTGSSVQCSVMTDLGRLGVGGREVQEGGLTCIHIVDLLHCTTEINTAL